MMLFGKNTVTTCDTEAEKYCSLQTESYRLTSEESKLSDGHSLIAAPESCKGLNSAAQAHFMPMLTRLILQECG
jgi:hypothetical protein